jgi:regulator of protease activity HflC (stomatin/prohibitin superfamily)
MTAIVIALLVVIALYGATRIFRVVGQAEVMVVERLGRFNRIARSGLNILLPFIERPRAIDVRYAMSDPSGAKRLVSGSTTRIDLREQVLNFPSQPVITKDNVTIDIDAVLYYRIADPQKATYAVQNAAVTNAEASKRAAILEAEGVQQSQVSRAQGEMEAAVLRAKGQAQARLAMADAEAQAIQRISAAMPAADVALYLLGLKYLEALPALTQGKGSTIFLPAEAAGVMGALGGLRELMARTGVADRAAAAPDSTPAPAAASRPVVPPANTTPTPPAAKE